MRKLITIVTLLIALHSSAQYEVSRITISSGGGVDTSNGYLISYTIGETFTDTASVSGAYEINAGYHAPLDTLFIWNGITNADWFVPTNWTPNGIPNGTNTDVIIPSGTPNAAVCSAPVTVNDILLENGSLLTLNADVNVTGVWSSRGTGTGTVIGNGTVILNGIFGNLVYGALQFNQLTANTGTDTVRFQPSANVDVVNVLNLQSGNLRTSAGSLTLLSSDTLTAVINDFTAGHTGTFNGNITAQRYITGTGNIQHQMGSPVNNTPFTQLGASGAAGNFIPTAGCDETQAGSGSPVGTLYQWNESTPASCILEGWQSRVAGNTENGRGYSIIANGGSVRSVSGVPNLNSSYSSPALGNSNYNLPTLQSSGVYTFESGWHLLSNPYPSAYTYAAEPGFAANGFVYVPSGPFNGTYQPLTPGMVIAPFQGIMVFKTPGAPAAFTFHKANRSLNGSAPFYQNNNPLTLNIQLSGNNYSDQTQLSFTTGATSQFDSEFDLRKQRSNLGQPTLFTGDNNFPFAINTLAGLTQTVAVGLGLIPGNNGNFTCTINGIQSFDPTTYIYLEDKVTGTMQNLRANNTYTFSMTNTENVNRFVLHFTPAAQINLIDATCSGNGQIQIQQPGTAQWQYQISNSIGAVVSVGHVNQSNPAVVNLPADLYTLTFSDTTGYSVVKQIQLNGTIAPNASFTASANSVETRQDIAFNSSSTNAASLSWQMGDGHTYYTPTVTHQYQFQGIYTVTLTVVSADGCTSTATQTVTVTPELVNGVATTNSSEISITAYPNPAITTLHISVNQLSQQAELRVFNALGQLILSPLVVINGMYKIDVSQLPSGTYTAEVKTTTSSQAQTVRFIKE